MATDNRTCSELLSEIETLRLRLEEAEETLHAIYSGEVDALVISRPEGEQIFTLQGAEHPYRILVESMSEGAAFLTSDGKIVYCNKQLADLLQVPIEKLISSPLVDCVAHQDQALFTGLLKKTNIKTNRGEITLNTGAGNKLLVILSCSVINLADNPGVGVVVTDITERKKMEDISNTAYQYARSLLEVSLDPLVTVSVDGKVMDVNEATITVTGIERDQLIGSNVFAYFTEPELARTGLKKVFSQGTVTDYPLAIRHVSGKVTDVLYNASIYRNPQGEVAGVFAAARDVTAGKLAEAKLQNIALYARSLLEASLDPLVTISVDGKIMDVNQATLAATGISREQLIGSDFSAYFTEPDLARTGYQQVFSQGTVTDYPLAIRHVSGKVTDVLYNASIYRNPQGEVAGVFAAARDVTDRKLAEQRLETNLYYTRSLIEASLDLMVTLSLEGKIISVNKATEQMTGVTRTQLVDSDLSLYFVEPEKLLAAHQAALTHGFVVEYPLTIKQGSGTVVEVLYNASPYRNQSGAIEGLLGVARNVTEHNKTEEKLRLAASVFDHAWEGILITTTDGTIVNVNEAFTRITSYSRDEVLGQNR
ncbi:PAS domain S-box protein [Methylobacter sp. S3L5C]|uniref:PAS domain-containing protein n=1 Tax=Methylobacter sp. S3L5C TaxID=2839024 RepID=UPI001FAD5D29|nr:PAS domain S-box protein [Methylobacter sp. S3L5C]UOA08455.1 PAS domain S-box protein [Methylobacter sp. S3L5C]